MMERIVSQRRFRGALWPLGSARCTAATRVRAALAIAARVCRSHCRRDNGGKHVRLSVQLQRGGACRSNRRRCHAGRVRLGWRGLWGGLP